jgi:hypothetical protein
MPHELGDLSPHYKSRSHAGQLADVSLTCRPGFLERVAWPPHEQPHIYVCGPTAFVEAATSGPWSKATRGATRSRLSGSARPRVDVTHLLDGNAVSGDLFAVFGREMTIVIGRCRDCGTACAVAELGVYPRAPGTVVRRPSCHAVVMVPVTVGDACPRASAGSRASDVGLARWPADSPEESPASSSSPGDTPAFKD